MLRLAPLVLIAGCYPQVAVRHPPWVTAKPPITVRIQNPAPAAAPTLVRGVVLGPTGEPVAGAVVTLLREDGAANAAVPPVTRIPSSPDGHFSMVAIYPGTYRLSATGSNGTTVFHAGVAVDLHRQPLPVELHLGPEGISIRGTLLDGRGLPAPHTWIQVFHQQDRLDVAFVETDDQGAYSVEVEPGDYGLAATLPGHEDEQRLVHVTDSQDLDLRLQLSPVNDAPSPEVIASMKSDIIPLSMDSEQYVADPDRFGSVLSQARVVLLGESTNGAHELSALKQRILAFLVTNLDFNILAIDADFGETLAVNEYVLQGTGDPVQALKGLHDWRWDNDDALALVRWMRVYNANKLHLRKLKLAGVDVRRTAVSTRALLDYFKRVDPAYQKQLEPLLASEVNPSVVAEITIRLAVQKTKYLKKSSRDAWTLATRHGRLLAQWAALAAETDSSRMREQFMAENTEWLLEREGPLSRLAFWSTNSHIKVAAADDSPKPMGQYLREALSDGVYAFGMTFNQGSFQTMKPATAPDAATELSVQTVEPLPAGSLETTLGAAEVPLFAVDFHTLPPKGTSLDFFYQRRLSRNVGETYDAASSQSATTPARTYDGLLFVDKVTAEHPIPLPTKSSATAKTH